MAGSSALMLAAGSPLRSAWRIGSRSAWWFSLTETCLSECFLPLGWGSGGFLSYVAFACALVDTMNDGCWGQ